MLNNDKYSNKWYFVNMDTFTAEIIKTLELLAFKRKESDMREKDLWGKVSDVLPEIVIYEDDLEALEMSRFSLAFYLDYLEKQRYIFVENLYDPSKFSSENYFDEDILADKVMRLRIFTVIISDSIFKVLENYKRGITPDEPVKWLAFDERKSILSVGGFKVEIARQDKQTNEHKILKNIFIDHKDNLADDFYYAEIAKEEFGVSEEEYTNAPDGWKRYHVACKSINEKIREATDNKIKLFLMFNATISGKVRINPEYITIP